MGPTDRALSLSLERWSFRTFFSTASFTYGGRVYGSHDNLLTAFEGTDGIKTGYTQLSGFNLVTSAVRNNKHVVGVVMGGPSAAVRDHEMMRLLTAAFKVSNDNPTVLADANVPWRGGSGPGTELFKTDPGEDDVLLAALESKGRQGKGAYPVLVRDTQQTSGAPVTKLVVSPDGGRVAVLTRDLNVYNLDRPNADILVNIADSRCKVIPIETVAVNGDRVAKRRVRGEPRELVPQRAELVEERPQADRVEPADPALVAGVERAAPAHGLPQRDARSTVRLERRQIPADSCGARGFALRHGCVITLLRGAETGGAYGRRCRSI